MPIYGSTSTFGQPSLATTAKLATPLNPTAPTAPAPAPINSGPSPQQQQPSTSMSRWEDFLNQLTGGNPMFGYYGSQSTNGGSPIYGYKVGSHSPQNGGTGGTGGTTPKPTTPTTPKPTTPTTPKPTTPTTPKPSTGFNTIPTSLANLLQQLSGNAGQLAMPGGPVAGIIQAPAGSGRASVAMTDPSKYGRGPNGGEATFYRTGINGGMVPLAASGAMGVPDAWNPTGVPKTPVTGAPPPPAKK